MPSWNDVLTEIKELELHKQEAVEAARSISPLDSVRGKYLTALADLRGRNVICYYSGWLQNEPGMPSSIEDDDMNGFMNAVHDLDRSKGLDLILHTPGGDLAATEAIVNYLRSCFKDDICAIVPQMAMSAGTMIACSCKEIIMGRQSSLGPTDPQLGGVPAGGVIEEFENAIREIEEVPSSAMLWSQIIGKYHPTFLGECQKAVDASRDIVGRWLKQNMLDGDPTQEQKAAAIVDRLCDHKQSAMHNRHFSYDDLSDIGMKVTLMEDNGELQDAALTIHHAFMNTFALTDAVKIIESSNGKRWIRSVSTQ